MSRTHDENEESKSVLSSIRTKIFSKKKSTMAYFCSFGGEREIEVEKSQ